MKIDSSLKPVGPGNVSSSRPKANVADTRTDSTAAEVRLSSASAQLAAGASSGAPIDGARIAEIKQAISEGRFKVNSEAIADSLLNTARDLLQSQRKA